MKNVTNFRKPMETGVDPHLIILLKLVLRTSCFTA